MAAAQDYTYEGVPRVNVSDYDILLGRGRGPSNHVGNKRFLAVCKLYEEEYNAATKFKQKSAVADQVFEEVTVTHNARFLQLVPTGKPMRNVVEEGEWVVASKKSSMDKIKQALREKRSHEDGKKESVRATAPESVPSSTHEANLIQMRPYTAALREQPVLSEGASPIKITWDCQEDNLFGGVTVGSDLWAVSDVTALQSDAALASDHPIGDFSLEASNSMKVPDHLNDGMDDDEKNLLRRVEKRRRSSDSIGSGILSRISSIASLDSFVFVSPNNVFDDRRSSFIDTRLLLFERDPSLQQQIADLASLSIDEEELLTAPLPDDRASESLLNMLGMTYGQPIITDEELEAERAAMTGEEKAAALSDVFGKYCNVDCPKDKRARVQSDSESIDLLLNDMRIEIAMIPAVNRKAITEAISKCAPYEFSDKRLERFLRCEDMDAKRGAQRFVNYWETRRKLFGPDKFLLPMKLSEALRDDLDAIEDGVFVVLPCLDMSGRILQFVEPCRRREGRYSSQSLLRAFWYAMEVTSQVDTDPRCGHVTLAWHKRTSLWNYDREASDQMVTFEKTCLPARLASVHVCCPSSIVMKILRPILMAIKTKYSRYRMSFHDVPETEIANALTEYGIQPHMIPTEMGGTIPLNLYHAEWIANRRSIEMTEI